MEEPRKTQPLSPRKLAAVLANLKKANAVKRTPASYTRSRHNATKHGLFVRKVEDTFELLGEDPQQFPKLLALFERVYVPTDKTERMLIRRLVEAVARRLRLFPAQARWQQESLRRSFASFPALERLDAEETLLRGLKLREILADYERFFKRARLLNGEVERLLRLLLAHRSARASDFGMAARRNPAIFAELSTNPEDWKRRYAAAVPLPKTVARIRAKQGQRTSLPARGG